MVDIDGPADLTPFLPLQREICGRPVIEELMGGAPQSQPAHWKDGNPAERLPLHAAQLLVASAILSPADADVYAAKARAAGDRALVLKLEHAGHFDPIAPGTPAWAKVEDFIVANALK